MLYLKLLSLKANKRKEILWSTELNCLSFRVSENTRDSGKLCGDEFVQEIAFEQRNLDFVFEKTTFFE